MTTTDRVREYLKTADMKRASRDNVASALCMTGGTMARKLRDEGMGFSTLIEDERRRRITELLDSPRCNADRLADACGYSTGKNFYRAFKAIFGKCYLEHRRQSA